MENEYNGGENFNLKEVLLKERGKPFLQKCSSFQEYISSNIKQNQNLYFREIHSPASRETLVKLLGSQETKKMLMFGSNNYLDLANDEKVWEGTLKYIKKYGHGVGGPPILNGYTRLHKQLEERLSDLKKTEETLLYASGYSANTDIALAIPDTNDLFMFDKLSHASLVSGLRRRSGSVYFKHNDCEDLQRKITNHKAKYDVNDTFIAVEGVYSMDGNTSHLDKIIEIKKNNNALLILDDAHGTTILGENGRGTAEHYGVCSDVDISMGTFSKSFAMTGGFISASKEIISYLRFFGNSYMFSASLPTSVIATILASLDLLDEDPFRRIKLLENVKYTYESLLAEGLDVPVKPEAGIISVRIPADVNIRRLNYSLHKKGIFVNSIEYPAVPMEQQRLRVSLMSSHTKEDINFLVECIKESLIENSFLY